MGLSAKQIRDMEEMTDEELAALAGISVTGGVNAGDLNALSDDELQAIAYGGAPTKGPVTEAGQGAVSGAAPLKDYADASRTDVAGEMLNAGRRGVRIAAEGAGDIYDIGRAAVDQFIPGMEDRSILDAANPFAAPDKGDIAREENIWAPNREAVERRIKPGGSMAMDFANTALETAPSAFVFGGAKGMGGRLVETALTSLGAGAGEQGTRAGAEALGLDPTSAQEIGEIVGSILGGVASPTGTAKANELVAKITKRVSKPTGGALTPQEAADALKKILAQADDPTKALANIRAGLDKGEAGTMADLAQDAGIYNVEGITPKGSIAARNSEAAVVAREAGAVAGSQKVFGGALPDSPLATDIVAANTGRLSKARAKVGGYEQATGARLNTQAETALTEAEQARKLADEIAGEVAPRSLASEQGKKTADLFATKQEGVNEVTKRLWKEFEAAPNIDTRGFPEGIEAEIARLPLADQRDVRAMLANVTKTVAKFDDSMPPREVQALIKKIKGQLQAKAADGSKKFNVSEAQVAGITKRIEDAIKSSPAGQAYQTALDATKQGYDTMGRGGLEKARRTASPETLAGAIKLKGAAGAQTAREAIDTGDQRVVDRIKETLRAEAGRSGVTPKFMDDYADVLNAFEDVGEDMNMVLGLNTAAETAAETAKAAEVARVGGLTKARGQASGRTGRINATINADFARDPMGVVNRVLSNDATASRDMPALIRSVAKNPAQKAQLKQMVGEALLSPITKSDISGGAFKEGNDLAKNFQNVRGSLKELLDPAELTALDEIVASFSNTRALRKATAKQPAVKLSQGATLAASGVAAGILKFVPGGTSLILANNVRTYIKSAMLTTPDPLIMKSLNDMTGNPQAFKQALANFTPTPGQTDKMIAKELADYLIEASRRKLQGPLMVPAVKSSGDEETIF